MAKNFSNLQMRIGRCNNFFNDNPERNRTNNLYDHRQREVRMAGDSLITGLRPRISFKQDTRPSTQKLKFALQNCFDDDLQMSVNNNNNHDFYERQVTVRGRGRGNMIGKLGPYQQIDLRKKLTQVVLADSNWYKVIIPCGSNFPKSFIINKILEHISPDTFVPIMYQLQEKSATFYVDNNKIAKRLLACDNKIFLNDNFRLHVFVKPGYLLCKVDDAFKEKVSQVVMRRYNQETNALDLSRFHHDQDLADNYFCAMFQPSVFTTVLDIAAKLLPNLRALNLDENKFTLIDRLGTLKSKFKNLKILYIGNNLLTDISLLDPIRNLNLEELRLSGNDFCQKYSMRQNKYVSDVREKFPKLLRLDAMELPPPISFDVVEEGLQIPSSRKAFSSNSNVSNIAGRFFDQYFNIFDSENRQDLMEAYHENAVFSMTIAPNLGARPTSYLGESRNLLRLNDPNRIHNLLKRGRLCIVSKISEFPRTKHDWESFTMDASLCCESMMLVTVTGLFKEVNDLESPFRYFNRTFVIVPEGSGYCIINEQLCIYNATQLQQKRAMNRKRTQQTIMGIEPTMDTQIETVTSSDEEIKTKMVQELSQVTNMNLIWSQKCLNDVQWNYDSALSAFQQFYKQNLIPAEAFENKN